MAGQFGQNVNKAEKPSLLYARWDEPNPKFKQGLNTGLNGRQYVLNYYVNDSKKRLKALDDYTEYK